MPTSSPTHSSAATAIRWSTSTSRCCRGGRRCSFGPREIGRPLREPERGNRSLRAIGTPMGPTGDAYGAGDSFAAGLTFALGSGWPVERAVAFAARCGAACAGVADRTPDSGTAADVGRSGLIGRGTICAGLHGPVGCPGVSSAGLPGGAARAFLPLSTRSAMRGKHRRRRPPPGPISLSAVMVGLLAVSMAVPRAARILRTVRIDAVLDRFRRPRRPDVRRPSSVHDRSDRGHPDPRVALGTGRGAGRRERPGVRLPVDVPARS